MALIGWLAVAGGLYWLGYCLGKLRPLESPEQISEAERRKLAQGRQR